MKVNFRRTWQISLIMAVLMLVIGIAIAPRDVDLYAQHMESLMAKGDYQEALKVGERSDKTNRKLLQLRMEALNHEHLLGERLFQYPITGKGDEFIKKGGDYELCGYLINKDLCYHWLGDFDRKTLEVIKSQKNFQATPVTEIWQDDGDPVLCYMRGDLVFVFNFSPTRSYTDYGFLVPTGSYEVVLNTDAK